MAKQKSIYFGIYHGICYYYKMRKFIRKLQRTSRYSYFLTLPKSLIRKFRWRERQKLEVSFGGRKKKLTIKDWEKKSKAS